ncbi:Immunoglobulin super DCC subclass member 3 [Desmophyllum pertusum]|uniref:Immunoglobulin super DCC subclass member 3 n=1 Tax=Desmophyllum pertusum TaxID=174260 RepID=A0A9W9YWG4_9CNID|nr:Immunoglobulin super DCC subclass member 3 [Desmophyllum pertusum]
MKGDLGIPGVRGEKGMMGTAGEQGKQGIKGRSWDSWSDAGAPGHPGPKGEPGESISAPEVIVSPASLTVTQNQTATFYCSVDGNPKPTVSWGKINGTGLENMEGPR